MSRYLLIVLFGNVSAEHPCRSSLETARRNCQGAMVWCRRHAGHSCFTLHKFLRNVQRVGPPLPMSKGPTGVGGPRSFHQCSSASGVHHLLVCIVWVEMFWKRQALAACNFTIIIRNVKNTKYCNWQPFGEPSLNSWLRRWSDSISLGWSPKSNS